MKKFSRETEHGRESERKRDWKGGEKNCIENSSTMQPLMKYKNHQGFFLSPARIPLSLSFFLFVLSIFHSPCSLLHLNSKKGKYSDYMHSFWQYNHLVDHNINCTYAIEQQKWERKEERMRWNKKYPLNSHRYYIMMVYDCVFLDSIFFYFGWKNITQ